MNKIINSFIASVYFILVSFSASATVISPTSQLEPQGTPMPCQWLGNYGVVNMLSVDPVLKILRFKLVGETSGSKSGYYLLPIKVGTNVDRAVFNMHYSLLESSYKDGVMIAVGLTDNVCSGAVDTPSVVFIRTFSGSFDLPH